MRKEDLSVVALLLEAVDLILGLVYIGLQIFYGLYYHVPPYKFILNLLPSGILRDSTVNVMGNGMVIDLEHLVGEIGRLTEKGIHISPENLKISDKAIICMPYHKLMDCLEEDRLQDKKFGSTRRGISPVYADKYMKKALRMGDLLHLEILKERLKDNYNIEITI